MPVAKGKSEIKLVVQEPLKAQLDAEAADRGIDRSSLICQRLLASYDEQDPGAMERRLDQVIRDLSALREDMAQVITLMETFVAGLGKPPIPSGEKVYPTPATLEETYPELKTMQASVPPTDAPTMPAKRWTLWPR